MLERIARWFARFKPVTPSAERAEGYTGLEEPIKPTERVSIDCAEVQRLRAAGVSWRKISRLLPGMPAQSTVRYQFEQWLSRQRSDRTPEAKVVHNPILPETAVEPRGTPAKVPDGLVTGVAGLASPVVAAAPAEGFSAPPTIIAKPEVAPDAPEADTLGVFGLDSVPTGSRAFFLVRGELNATLAANMGQRAVGVDRWEPGYWRLPQFRDASRIWVVVNVSEDNRAFLQSVAADERLRALCLLAAPRPWVTVQSVARDRLLAQRRLGSGYSDRIDFESPNGFQPLPSLGQLAEWLRQPDPPMRGEAFDPFYQPAWEYPRREWTPR